MKRCTGIFGGKPQRTPHAGGEGDDRPWTANPYASGSDARGRIRHLYTFTPLTRVRHSRVRHSYTCTPLEYVTYVELQHAATAGAAQPWTARPRLGQRRTCTCTPLVYVYATRVRDVRRAAARGSCGAGVGLRGRHGTPRVYATRVYAARVRVR
jgi:hypothetical protein